MDTILIVDDEPDLREALRAVLESAHYRVVDCSDGHEARLRVFEDPPDLIISDVRMPGMDGWELVHELHQLPLTMHTPFLFLTGHADASTFSDAIRAGVDGVLTKPIRSQDLLDAVEARLRRRRGPDASAALFRATLSRALPHGLNTPLHIIGGYVNLLASLEPEDRATVSMYAGRIQDALKRLQNSLQKLWLLLSLEDDHHQTSGVAHAEPAPDVCLQPLLQQVADELTARYGRPIQLPSNASTLFIRTPLDLSLELFRELMENALLFSPPDSGVVITASGSGSVSVSITDQGRGLNATPIEGLSAFEAFQRQRFERKGHGLGLTLVHRLLRRIGGDISIAPSSPTGTSVTVTLPGRAS